MGSLSYIVCCGPKKLIHVYLYISFDWFLRIQIQPQPPKVALLDFHERIDWGCLISSRNLHLYCDYIISNEVVGLVSLWNTLFKIWLDKFLLPK